MNVHSHLTWTWGLNSFTSSQPCRNLELSVVEIAEEAVNEPSKAAARRAQLLEAAAKCFNREGFHAASMASIAAEAAMSVGQIYRHFENKEAVIEALVERSLEDWALRMADMRAQPSSDLVDQMLTIACFHADKMGEKGKAALSLEFLAEAARNPRIAGIVHRVDSAVREQLKAVLLRADVPDADMDCRLTMLMMMIDGWVVRAVK